MEEFLKGAPRGRSRISQELIQRMRELRAQGYSYAEISRELGVGSNTVAKYTRDITPTIPGRRVALPPEKAAEARIYQQVTKEVVESAMEEYDTRIQLGNAIYSEFGELAKIHNMPLVDLVRKAITFYEFWKDYVDELREKVEILERMVKYLIPKVYPIEAYQDLLRFRRQYLMWCMLKGMEPDEGIIEEIDRRLNSLERRIPVLNHG